MEPAVIDSSIPAIPADKPRRNTSIGGVLRNAQPYDLALVSNDQQVNRLARLLYTDLLETKSAPRFPQMRDTVVSVILNLFSAYSHEPSRYVRYSRDGHRYNRQSRYNPVSIGLTKLKRVVKALETAQLIEHHCGVFAHTEFSQGRQSRMRATPKLIQLMTEHRLTLEMIDIDDEDEIIILKSIKDYRGSATSVEYTETPDTRRMRRNLLSINKLLASTEIGLEKSTKQIQEINQRLSQTRDRFPINFLHKRLRRIFNNNNFTSGGRFYHGWWESIPSTDRACLTINGEQTVEIDYSGVHFCIFYSQIGQALTEDPYALPGVNTYYRPVIKMAAQCMINAADTKEAVRALRREAQEDGLAMPPEYPHPQDLIAALAKKHTPIRHLFCSGYGVKAQFIDSQVAETVMLTMAESGVPVLSVHDSFIAPARHAERLCKVMATAFANITGGQCSAKIKPYSRLGMLPDNLHADDF